MILVTGGTGLVGAHLLYKLVSEGKPVRAIYRTEQTLTHVKKVFSCYTENYTPLFEAIAWVKADILDIPALEEAFTNISYVYHCAALVSFDPSKFQLLRKTNIEGTANIVNLCIASNVKKLCYVSSIAAVGNPVNTEIITEKTNWNPEEDHSPYAITKYGAELEVWRGTQEGLSAVIVNPGVILGAGIWHNGSGQIFKKIHQGLKHYTSGSVSLVSVNDVVNIMVTLLESNITKQNYILVGEQLTYEAFLTHIAQHLNVKPPYKLVKLNTLAILWRMDWLAQKVFRRPRRLTKHITEALTTSKTYSNTKIIETLNYSFEPAEDAIKTIATLYLQKA